MTTDLSGSYLLWLLQESNRKKKGNQKKIRPETVSKYCHLTTYFLQSNQWPTINPHLNLRTRTKSKGITPLQWQGQPFFNRNSRAQETTVLGDPNETDA